jgi:hypothetical protein
MLQVRVKVRDKLKERYEYLFGIEKMKWEPILDKQAEGVQVDAEDAPVLASLKLIPPEDKKWFLVNGLRPKGGGEVDTYHTALREFSPDSGSFILVSQRRRKIPHTK